jgi:hypothetical protein
MVEGALGTLIAGDSLISPDSLRKLLEAECAELETVSAVGSGAINRAIARRLSLTDETIKFPDRTPRGRCSGILAALESSPQPGEWSHVNPSR